MARMKNDMARMQDYADDELIANPFAFAAQAPVAPAMAAPVAAPVAATLAAPIATPIARQYNRDNPSGLDENGFPLPNGGSKYSPTQGYGMVPVYAQQGRMSERFDDFGQPLEPAFLGYEFNPIAAGLTTVDALGPKLKI